MDHTNRLGTEPTDCNERDTGPNIDSHWTPIEHVFVAGTWVAAVTRDGLVDAALRDAEMPAEFRKPRLVFDANGHGISLAAQNSAFRKLLQQGDIIHADGGFLVTASKWLCSKQVPERSATTDMIHDFAQKGKGRITFYLLGGEEDVNRRCASILQERYPALRIVGRRNGYFLEEDEGGIVADINRASPDIVWVGLGKPLEQDFCVRNRNSLNASWLITCGGCYNYITGDYARAPLWMQRANLEWLHRMITRPKQLLWRYLTTTPHALLLTLFRSSGAVLVKGRD